MKWHVSLKRYLDLVIPVLKRHKLIAVNDSMGQGLCHALTDVIKWP